MRQSKRKLLNLSSMQLDEFVKFCDENKPAKVIGGHRVEIQFENGATVEINAEADYDGGATLVFDSSMDEEKRTKEYNERKEREDRQRREFEETKERVKSKYTPEQWSEIEQAFLYNNGMTFEQNKKLQEESRRWAEKMKEKYGNEGIFDHVLNSL